MHISENNSRLIVVYLNKQKVLDADTRSIQQTVFQGVAGGGNGAKIRRYKILEKSKETVLEFYKDKNFVRIYQWLNIIK